MSLLNNIHVIPFLRALHIGEGIMWVGSAAFTDGAVASPGSYVIGAGFFGKMQARIEKPGAEMESAKSAPKPSQVQEINRLQSSLMKADQFVFILLVVAMLAMAVARYL